MSPALQTTLAVLLALASAKESILRSYEAHAAALRGRDACPANGNDHWNSENQSGDYRLNFTIRGSVGEVCFQKPYIRLGPYTCTLYVCIYIRVYIYIQMHVNVYLELSRTNARLCMMV